MPARVTLQPPLVSADPGAVATTTVRVKNEGSVVEQFALTVLGDAARWTRVEPPSLSLLPGDEGTASVIFSPPRDPSIAHGRIHFGVKVAASADPQHGVVEEGDLDIGEFEAITARLLPRTLEERRKGETNLHVTNAGNASETLHLHASDPDEQLVFDVDEEVVVPAGATVKVPIKVAARKKPGSTPRNRPYHVLVEGSTVDKPFTVDGTFNQLSRSHAVYYWVAAAVVAGGIGLFLSGALDGVIEQGRANLPSAPSTTELAPIPTTLPAPPTSG